MLYAIAICLLHIQNKKAIGNDIFQCLSYNIRKQSVIVTDELLKIQRELSLS